MSFTPEDLSRELQALCGKNLRSVVLYGSAAAGDHAGKRSDYNVLIVLDRLGTEELKTLSGLSFKWAKAGNPPPLLFTWNRLRQSGDVFPIELADIQETRRVLFGEDPLDGVPVNLKNIRQELEHELKGKLIGLRERFLLTRGKPREVEELLVSSLSTFLVLFRAALRLHMEHPPVVKLEALRALRERIEFDDEAFRLIQEMKEGRKPAGGDPLALFDRYLKAVEAVTDAVDSWVHAEKNGDKEIMK